MNDRPRRTVLAHWLLATAGLVLLTAGSASAAVGEPFPEGAFSDGCLGVDHFPEEAVDGAPSAAVLGGSLPPELAGLVLWLVLTSTDPAGEPTVARGAIDDDGLVLTDPFPLYAYGEVGISAGKAVTVELLDPVGPAEIAAAPGVQVDPTSWGPETVDAAETTCDRSLLVAAPPTPTTTPTTTTPTTTTPPTTTVPPTSTLAPTTVPATTAPPTTAPPLVTPAPSDGRSWVPFGLVGGGLLVAVGIAIAFAPLGSSGRTKEPAVRAVIFVPGIMASAIRTKTDRGLEPLWPPTGYQGDVSACLEVLSALDASDLEVYAASGDGLLPGIHRGLLKFLEGHGYSLRQDGAKPPNCYVHSYNWLSSCDDAAKSLADLVQHVTDVHKAPPSVIAHSMGGLVTRAAVMRHGAKLDRAFYIGSPHYGAPMAYFALHPDIPYQFLAGAGGVFINAAYAVASATGWDPPAPPPSGSLAAGLSTAADATATAIRLAAQAAGGSDAFDQQMKRIAQNATGVFELLPDDLYFRHVAPTWPVVTHRRKWGRDSAAWFRYDFSPATPEEAYVAGPVRPHKDITALPPHLVGKIRAALEFKRSIAGPLPPGGEDRTIVIYGKRHPTGCTATMTDDGPADTVGTIACTLGGDQGGDGTVPTESGRAEALWGAGVTVERDDSAEHFMMTETPRCHAIIAQYLPPGGR